MDGGGTGPWVVVVLLLERVRMDGGGIIWMDGGGIIWMDGGGRVRMDGGGRVRIALPLAQIRVDGARVRMDGGGWTALDGDVWTAEVSLIRVLMRTELSIEVVDSGG
jgi:hypothetical protein